MTAAELREIGSIDLLDLDIISTFYGRDFLPYPFMFTQPSRFAWHDEYSGYARTVPDRFTNGDLRIFQECAGFYAHADIRVECHVQHIPADTPSIRVIAARFDQAGFLAKQRPDEDILDIYALSPYLLGPAVAEAAALDKPGGRPAIVIPEYLPGANNGESADDFSIHHSVEGAPRAAEVPRALVTAFGTVQSHWRPTRWWGMDPGKNHAAWVRIKDDGDYLYQPDYTEARPLTSAALGARIDQLISEDVKALRQFRSR
jgi:hypothetical protein